MSSNGRKLTLAPAAFLCINRRMLVKGEGLIRLEAERRFVRLYAKEYERLVNRHGHVEAMRRLVDAHKARYNDVARESREVQARQRRLAAADGQAAPAA
jgi:hypothetical protein